MLVTERPGRLRMVSATGELSPPLAGNRMIYLSFAEDRGNGRAGASVARAKVDAAGRALEDLQVIFRCLLYTSDAADEL